ncbi:MAG: YiiX/YebB-like N1pC/P60 family cysteine hydrolase [Cyanobacteriota bacterium]|mgnify:CR=1 FL=1
MSGINKEFSIGNYDSGLFDLSDKVNAKKITTANTKDEALNIAKNNAGAEIVVQRKDEQSGLAKFDVYSLKVDDKSQKIGTVKDVGKISFFGNSNISNPVNAIEDKTGTKGALQGFIVAENNEVSQPIYKQQFQTPRYEKVRDVLNNIRESVGIEQNAPWVYVVDTVMGGSSPSDNLPPIDKKEIQNMKANLKKGDIIMNGNDGSFIHGILYVGKDAKLQEQMEKKWGLEKGALKDEGLIIHSLLSDSDTETEYEGKKQTIKASGAGVNVDTIERYTARHPRDVMIAVTMKDATDQDRESAVNTMKSYVGKGYDKYFRNNDDKEMYCTEAVSKAWLNSSRPPDFSNQLHPLVSYPEFVLKKLPESVSKSLQDGGRLHNEMIMTDGIATSKSTTVVWASQNADKSEFVKKHERWADAAEGKSDKGYQEMVTKDIPEQSRGSRALLEKIKAQAEKTRNEMKEAK